ncbi:MAG: zf-HC2 domain-containing protein [Nitrospirota bacterium]
MTCDAIQERLAAYVERQLDPETHRLVETHLASCPTCRAEAEALAGVIRAVADLPVEAPPPGFSQAVMARVRAEPRAPTVWERLFVPLWIKLPVHAVAWIVVIAAGWYLFRATPPVQVQVAQRSEEVVGGAAKGDELPAEPHPGPPPETAIAPTEKLPTAPGGLKPPATDADVRRMETFERQTKDEAAPGRYDAKKESGSRTTPSSVQSFSEPDQELTVALNDPPGDEQALARVRAAVERAGGSPLPTAPNTSDTVWLTINADRVDVLRQELRLLSRVPPDQPGKGDGPSMSAAAPPASLNTPLAGPGVKTDDAPVAKVRVRVTIQWAAPQQSLP